MRGGFTERTRSGTATFNDEFVQFPIDGNWIFTIKAGQAEFILWQAGRSDHPLNIQISDRIDSQVFDHLFRLELVSQEVFWVGKINAVITCVFVGRTADPQ